MSIIFNSLFNTMWVGGVFQQIFLAVDSVIYGIAAKMYNLFNTTVALNDYGNESSSQLFSTLPDIVSRIKTLFIVFMLFRLAFTLLGYLADPEKFSDSKSGSSKLVMNVVVSLAMLIISPYVFDLFNRIQYETMGSGSDGSNIIANIVLGDDGHVITGEAAGGKFVNKVFLLFCNIAGKSYTDDDSKNYSGFYSFLIFPTSANKVEDAFNDVNNGAPLGILATYISSTKIYYWPFISGIAGIFLIYFFFSFAIEVFIRLLKLKILEVISPVPILMYMDSGGQKYFQNFIKLYISVFLSFYLKLAGIYLAISLSTNVLKNWVADSSGIWLKLVVVMGIFYLTRELPKIFKDLFGVDMGDGKMKGSKFLSGLAGAGIVAAAGGIKSATTGMGFGGALIGAASGAVRGAVSGGSAQNVGQFVKGNYAAHQKNSKFIDTAKSVGGYGAMAMHGIDSVTGENKRSKSDMEAVKNVQDKSSAAVSAIESSFASKLDENKNKYGTREAWVADQIAKDAGYNKSKARLDGLRAQLNSGTRSGDATAIANAQAKVDNLRAQVAAHPNSEEATNDLKKAYEELNGLTNIPMSTVDREAIEGQIAAEETEMANIKATQSGVYNRDYDKLLNEHTSEIMNATDISTLSEKERAALYAITDYKNAVESTEYRDAATRAAQRDGKNASDYTPVVTSFDAADAYKNVKGGANGQVTDLARSVSTTRQAEYKRNSGGN